MKIFSFQKIAVASAAFALFSPFASIYAQDQFIGENQPVKRVIQLQPQNGSQVPATNNAASQFNPITATLGKPTVGFDEIQVPDVLSKVPQKQGAQALKPLKPATLGNQYSPLAPTATSPVTRPQLGSTATSPQIKKSFTPAIPVKFATTPTAPPTTANTTASAAATAITSDSQSMVKTSIEFPKFVNVNKTAPIQITVSNSGKTAVENVGFTATLPAHAELISSSPKPISVDGQTLKFELNRIGAEDKREIVLQVRPTTRQPIDIETNVTTENVQKVLMAVRQPELSLVINGPSQANVGEKVIHEVIVSNIGDGIASDIQLGAIFPPNLIELQSTLEDGIPEIQPGKSVKIKFESQAVSAGAIALKASAHSDDGAEPKTASVDMNVFEPTLQISAIGPKINFVDRNGIYTIKLENPGQVDITDVRVALGVPMGMKITTISREANVDATKGILRWTYDRIPAGSTEQIQMMAVVTEEGSQICHILVDSHETSEKEIQLSTQVTTRADVSVQLRNDSGPVQVGGKASFTVEVSNRGSKKASDVNVKIDLPESLRPVPVDDQKVMVEGNTILFTEPQIAPGKSTTFQFSAIGVVSGEHVVRSVTQIEDSSQTTVAEDVIFVYEINEARVSESLKPVVPRR